MPQLVAFGEDAGACVYAVSLAGAVYRLAAPLRRPHRCRAPTPRPRPRITSVPASPTAVGLVRVRLVGGRVDVRVPPRRRRLEPRAPRRRSYMLAAGAHLFEVRAADPGGTVDPTTAVTQITIPP